MWFTLKHVREVRFFLPYPPSIVGNLTSQSFRPMSEYSAFLSTTRYAVVTGANKGIGLGICRQLASHGVIVVLTARDQKKGLEALENFKNYGFSDHISFHQLDVTDSESIASLVDFIKSKFGKLDILVNNAAISGVQIDGDAYKAVGYARSDVNYDEIIAQSYEMTEECIDTNYYGVKRMTEAFLPLLNCSDSARIVNVSSSMGKLKSIQNEWARGILNDAERLTEERVDEVIKEFLKDFKEGSFAAKGWPAFLSAYTVSKAALNAYTRVMAVEHPAIRINSVCPGFVKTDLNRNAGILSVEEGAESPVRLALMPDGGPSGLFFVRKEVSSF
ncbi:hypothetical protein Nepgr_002371 [Nepenthes gracilis]|uniref:Short-chain dehydrogenase/reductase n=1 Tax=Nepenthes gracilis TaxID=150966 RepID=A0AAD3P9W9_NEPGR|nr:hypothetical protein Nepgr_002371 [Nepenthes gracilis]